MRAVEAWKFWASLGINLSQKENSMALGVYPQAAQIVAVTAIQLPYVTGLIKLTKSAITLGPATTQAELAAIEADFTGYAAKTLVALPAPFPDRQRGGITFNVPTQNFAVGSTPTIFNDIYAAWIESSTHDLLVAIQFNNPWPMQAALAALALDMLFNFYGDESVNAIINGTPV